MNPQNRKLFLIAMAIVEVLRDSALFFCRPLYFPVYSASTILRSKQYLSGVLGASWGRLGGAALLAIGVASWLARTDTFSPAQFGLLTGLLIYNAAAAILIASAGVISKMSGVALWPAAVLHATLTVWCISCLRRDRIAH